MAAPFSTTLTDFTKAFSTTWGESWGDIVWLIFEQSPLFYEYFDRGAYKMSAAQHAKEPFAHAENPNVGYYAGTQVLGTADSEFVKPFIWDEWGQISCQSVVPTDKVDLNANAERQIADLLEAEAKQCAVTLRNFIETELHTAAGASNEIDGLRGVLEFATAAAQAATGTSVGNVAKNATYHFNQYQQIAGGFLANGVQTWATLYRQCSRWGNRPNLMLVDPSIYDGYEEWCGPERALVDEKEGSAGFHGLRYKGAMVVPDYNITTDSGEGFMLSIGKKAPSSESGYNFKAGYLDPVKGKSVGTSDFGHHKLWINKNAFFFMDDWRIAQEQWALISKCKFHCIPTWSDLREHGTFDFAAGSYVA
jgi:hypothetical protein